MGGFRQAGSASIASETGPSTLGKRTFALPLLHGVDTSGCRAVDECGHAVLPAEVLEGRAVVTASR